MGTDLEAQKLFGKIELIATQTQREYRNYCLEKYDSHGFLIQITDFTKTKFSDGTFALIDESTVIYRRDSRGQILSSYRPSDDGEHVREKYLYEGTTCTITRFSGEKQTGGTTKEVYDQNGLILEEYYFRDIEQKELDFMLSYEYANGTLLKMIYLEPDKTGLNLIPDWEILYEYDEHGNLSHGVEQSLDGSIVKERSDAYCTNVRIRL